MKKGMRESQNLEFFWRQPSSVSTASQEEGSAASAAEDEIFTHVLPLQLYMTYMSFGPDQDFMR